jgi:hypothetical protein
MNENDELLQDDDDDTPSPRFENLTFRATPTDRALIQELMAAYGAASMSHLLRMGLGVLSRHAGASRDQLIKAAINTLQTALGAEDQSEPIVGFQERCEWVRDGHQCPNRPAFVVKTVADGERRVCGACVADKAFRRVKHRPILAGAI